jgi:hypothetical protein
MVKAKNIIKRFWNVEESDLEYEYFMDYVSLVANASSDSFKTFKAYKNDRRLDFVDLLTIARNVVPNVNVMITTFDPNYNPSIEEIITEKGICHTINGVLSSIILNVK